MDLTHITSQTLRRAISLSERKEELVKLIAELETELAKVLTGVAAPVLGAAPQAAARKTRKPAKAASARKGKSGGVKDRILALLDAAGSQGLKVKEIAEKLGSPSGNISVWFSTTGKKLTQKIEPGRYASKGVKVAAPAATPAAAAKPAPAVKKAAPAAKPAAAGKGKLTPEGRAKIAAASKARWAAHRAKAAGKPAAKGKAPAPKKEAKVTKASKPAPKAFRLPKPAKKP